MDFLDYNHLQKYEYEKPLGIVGDSAYEYRRPYSLMSVPCESYKPKFVFSDDPLKLLRVGDQVIVTEKEDSAKVGMTGTIVVKEPGSNRWGIRFDKEFSDGHRCCLLGQNYCESGYGHFVPEDKLKLLKTKNTIMFKLNNYIKKLVDADTQALLKAGYINGDLQPTGRGQDALISILFFANKDALVAAAKEEIAEAEAQAAKCR